MFNPTLLTQIDALKARLDRIRPLPPDLVDNLREVYNIRLTYHSNAIEGNTLTQSETQIVIEKGITIGGKPLKDHLEAINHVEAIDFIRDLAMDERAITEWDIRQIHGLVCKGDSPTEQLSRQKCRLKDERNCSGTRASDYARDVF
jgi:Fic family protein